MIIGISGKIGSGKDTIGKIINYLTDKELEELGISFEDFIKRYNSNIFPYGGYKPVFQIKKCADTLKDIVCLLINCTREQLEDEEFKNTELGEEWIRYGYADGFIHKGKAGDVVMNYQACSKERYEEELRTNWQTAYKSPLTPRLLLQLIGTECGRNIIHPDIWINALFSKYKLINYSPIARYISEEETIPDEPILNSYPNWLITDIRFPNEAQAVKDREGMLIRVNRDLKCEICKFTKAERRGKICKEITCPNGRPKHISETALDDYKDWDYVIDNNSTIESLIEQIKQILIKENII